jgi:hypothetical protein
MNEKNDSYHTSKLNHIVSPGNPHNLVLRPMPNGCRWHGHKSYNLLAHFQD